jgi:hypothetical protein
LVNPLTVIGEPEPVFIDPPGLAVTVYKVIGNPPLPADAEKLTTALPTPGTADTEVGAPGTIAATGTRTGMRFKAATLSIESTPSDPHCQTVLSLFNARLW